MPFEPLHMMTEERSALLPYRGKWDTGQLIHLLKRTMFGAKKADIAYFSKHSLEQVVDELLSPKPFDRLPPVNDYDFISAHNIPPGHTWVNAPYYNPHDAARLYSFTKWTMDTFIHQDTSIREKMGLCWHNHFATQTAMYRSQLIWDHHSMLRHNALGNFKTLTRLVTIDSHMLRYLNGEENSKKAPNENYGRELQELFCIGKGPGAKYTEDDVKQAARVLTGWKVDLEKQVSYFNPDDHDSSDKKFSSFYNNTLIKGKSGPLAGGQELDALLDMLFANRETALFICRKIYRWFVHYNIDGHTEKEVIIPLAGIMRKNNYEIRPVLYALLTSDHFYANTGGQIKSPVDFIIGMQREFDVQYASPDNYIINNSMFLYLTEQLSLMGQTYADPPNVSGWPAYYQSPGFYELWINTSTYPARNEFSNTMINYGFNREGRFFIIDTVAFARTLAHPGNPDALIDESLDLLYRVSISEELKKVLKKNTLLSGQEQDHYWTDAWNDHIESPGDANKKAVVELRLRALYSFIVASPEYQLI